MYQELAARLDVLFRQAKDVLVRKEEIYGCSWKKRGGVGAFMMLARKWDRIEKAVQEREWDVFKAVYDDPDSLLDDIKDLRNYLTLVEDEVTADDERREGNVEQRDGNDRKKYRGELT